MNILKKGKLIVCVSLGSLLVLSQILSNQYINYKLHNDRVPKIINNYDVVKSYDNDNLLMVSNARGYYGMMTSNGREIISPVWNSINVISEDRFIVSKTNDNMSISVGILDNCENTIVPMLFSSIAWENQYFLVGTLSENNKKILFDNNGNVQLFQEWDSCQISENVAVLKKGDTIATVKADDNFNYVYTDLNIPFKIFNHDFLAVIKNPLTDGISAYDDYSIVISSLSKYCEAMFNSDTDMIRSVTNSQYYNSLISNMLPNCKLKDITNLSIYGRPSNESGVGIVYNVSFNLIYTSTTTILDNQDTNNSEETPQEELTTIQLKMKFIRDDDGSIVLKSTEKTVFEQEPSTEEDIYMDF